MRCLESHPCKGYGHLEAYLASPIIIVDIEYRE
jgi:hypothetical protein